MDSRSLDACVSLTDGRRLEYSLHGEAGALTVLFLNGTPFGVSAVPVALRRAAERHGWVALGLSRPGYGESTPRPGRTVADVAADVRELADRLGLEAVVPVGFSGGGPHAVAVAALLGERCPALVLAGSLAPIDAAGLEWFDGMGDQVRAAAELARSAPAQGRATLEAMRASTPHPAGALAELLSKEDLERMGADAAREVDGMLRRAFAHGVDGMADDFIAFTRPWGVDPASVACPTLIVHGDGDRNVPFAHGSWLASHIPDARLDVIRGGVHFDLWPRLPGMLGWVAEVTSA